MGFLKRLLGRVDEPEVVLGSAPDPGWTPPPSDTRVGDRPPPPGQSRSVGHVYRSSQVFVNGQEVGPDGIAEAERLSGFDLDGDGRIAGGPAAGQSLQAMIDGAMASMATVAGAADDAGLGPDARVALLERLAALRDGGAITPAEFEAEKAKILGA